MTPEEIEAEHEGFHKWLAAEADRYPNIHRMVEANVDPDAADTRNARFGFGLDCYSAAEQDVIAEATASHVVGDPAAVVEQLGRLVTDTGADELMVTTSTFAHADRLASYELLARATVGQADRPGQPSLVPFDR